MDLFEEQEPTTEMVTMEAKTFRQLQIASAALQNDIQLMFKAKELLQHQLQQKEKEIRSLHEGYEEMQSENRQLRADLADTRSNLQLTIAERNEGFGQREAKLINEVQYREYMGRILINVLYYCTLKGEIGTLVKKESIDGFKNLASSTLEGLRKSYANNGVEKDEMYFVQMLFAIVANTGFSVQGRSALGQGKSGQKLIFNIVQTLDEMVLPNENNFKCAMINSLYNMSICNEGYKYMNENCGRLPHVIRNIYHSTKHNWLQKSCTSLAKSMSIPLQATTSQPENQSNKPKQEQPIEE